MVPRNTRIKTPTYYVGKFRGHPQVNSVGWAKKKLVFIYLFLYAWLNPIRTAVPFWGQASLIPSVSSPKRDCGAKRVDKILCIQPSGLETTNTLNQPVLYIDKHVHVTASTRGALVKPVSGVRAAVEVWEVFTLLGEALFVGVCAGLSTCMRFVLYFTPYNGQYFESFDTEGGDMIASKRRRRPWHEGLL